MYSHYTLLYHHFQDELGGGESMETGEEPETGQEMAVVLHEVS